MSAPLDRPSYAAVLRAPNAARTFAAALIARLSYGVVFLSLVLAITRSSGSYAVAGVSLALFGLTSAVLSPARAGLIDRYGLRRALLRMTLGYALLLLALAAVTSSGGAPDLLLWILCSAAGSCTPPLGPVMRTLWRDMLDGDLLLRAYSLDTVAEELLYVVGPLVAGGCAAFARPGLGVAVSAALVAAGVLLLLASPAVPAAARRIDVAPEEAEPPSAALLRGRRGLPAFGSRLAVGAPVLVSAGVGMCLGALSLLVVAFAAGHHHVAAVAWVEASLSAGSVLGGLVNGAFAWRATPRVRLSVLAAALGTAVAVAGLATDIVALCALVGVAGLFVSPALTTAYLAADETALPGARTRAGAWVNTGFNIGNGSGAAGVGLLVSTLPLRACFLLAGIPGVLTAVAPRVWRRRS